MILKETNKVYNLKKTRLVYEEPEKSLKEGKIQIEKKKEFKRAIRNLVQAAKKKENKGHFILKLIEKTDIIMENKD